MPKYFSSKHKTLTLKSMLFTLSASAYASTCSTEALNLEHTNLSHTCASEPPINMTYSVFGGVDSFRTVADGWETNYGAFIAGMATAEISPFAVHAPLFDGCGLQLGGSYGAYNPAGKFGAPSKHSSQGFITFAAYKRCLYNSPWGAGLAYDVMLSDNFGSYAKSPTLMQWRGKISTLISPSDECGIQGSTATSCSSDRSKYFGCSLNFKYRAISQGSLFWTHQFDCGSCTTIWAGIPFAKRLDQGFTSRSGQFLIGAEIDAPLAYNWTLNGRAQYMHPATTRKYVRSSEYGCNITVAVQYDFGGGSCYSTECAKPYFSLANNSNFLVDSKIATTNP